MVVNNRHKKNVLNNFRINEVDSEDISLENLSINEIQTNIIKHSWQYTVQLNPITFYENNSDIQPNNEHQVWKETHYLSLYKRVLSILNKLTWTTFDQLVDEFQKLPIENIECLENIANIVALKAFDEPSFGSLYACLCRVIDITINCQNENGLTYQMTFKKCVITVCQNYFEKQCLDNTDPIVMSVDHEQNQRRLKMQAIGCIRFIGEIFKQSLLSPYVVHYCIKTLLFKTKERSLEYLCNLLKVAGKELNEKISLEDIFEHLLYLVSDEMRSKISPRIRFMVKDVIEVIMPSRVL
ncbi:eukaryotic translation initiation factor 4 gamma 3-like [Melanaphis sacchari]|uniref:eukaryotic translation initiation factor 4 gamma 3-like n=1 Tax=Melanaphis sacchari TaxID=742174 RepID=UPI000DC13B9D|nr:eukaryotic translation initiation factor 4 gamma 3-like [Melanaphis sacchari]XP_025197501.1 eukaryotic translation initiation factor 4 gamma 3-like [Melanaphis sacchari]